MVGDMSRRLYMFFAIPPDPPPHFAALSHLVKHLGLKYWQRIVGMFFYTIAMFGLVKDMLLD